MMSGKANKLDGIYSKFAIALRKSSSKTQTKNIIKDKLYDCLEPLKPSEKEFVDKFKVLCYTKKSSPTNMKCKYALQKLNCYHQNKDIFEDDSSIEHIIPECCGNDSNNIGNLIILENKLNIEADDNNYQEKRQIYKKSNYVWIRKFVDEHPNWTEDMIDNRAEELAKLFYYKILST